MTTTTPHIRYVHINNDTNERGATIAYFRTEVHVFFGYSLKRKGDVYNKQIGRDIASKNLTDNLDWLSTTVLEEMENVCSSCYGNKLTHSGVMEIDMIKETLDALDVLSDTTMESLTMFDFKHSAISHVLKIAVSRIIDEVGV